MKIKEIEKNRKNRDRRRQRQTETQTKCYHVFLVEGREFTKFLWPKGIAASRN